MLYFIGFYVCAYLITLFLLLYLLKSTFETKLSFKSLPYITYYIVKFSKIKELYYGLILALTGIPPFLVFFIKFNASIMILPRFGFVIFYIAFLILFFKYDFL